MIQIVIASLGKGGAERSIILLLAELARRGTRVQLISLQDVEEEYQLDAALQPCLLRLRGRSFAHSLYRLYGALRCQESGVVYSLMPRASLASLLVCGVLGRTLYTSERTTPTRFFHSTVKLYLALLPHAAARGCVFISRYALTNGLPDNAFGRRIRRRASVLHNSVQSPVARAQAVAGRRIRVQRLMTRLPPLAGCPQPLKLLLASRLVSGKGVPEFLRAEAATILELDLRVVIAGAGPLASAIKEQLAELRLEQHVSLRGFVVDIHAEYVAADAVVLTSESEGFGRVGFEAYLAGCLVLGTTQNSFWREVVPQAPAWHVAGESIRLRAALEALARTRIPDDGSDLDVMAAALSVEVHATRFLGLVSGV